ncbi:hypothetical protein ACLI4U_01160 [Natrialbaceae archaeon A-CW2]
MGFNQIADALGAQVRRQILLTLLDHNPVGQTETMAKIHPRKKDVRELELIHVHLPTLDDMGYIVWDSDNENIVKGPNWEEIEPVIRLLRENSDEIPADTF